MYIIFLTECNDKVGFGHIIRVFSIAYEYKKQGHKIEIIVDGDDKLIKNFNECFNIKK